MVLCRIHSECYNFSVMKKTEKVLKALANLKRLHIIKVLKGEGEKFVGEIADDINLSFRATSKHLKILSAVEIVEKEQRGPQIFYTLSPNLDPISRLVLSSI